MTQIQGLVEKLAMMYLAAGIDRSRQNVVLEEYFEKGPQSLQAAIELFEHRLTLQEAVGNIQSSRFPRTRMNRLLE